MQITKTPAIAAVIFVLHTRRRFQIYQNKHIERASGSMSALCVCDVTIINIFHFTRHSIGVREVQATNNKRAMGCNQCKASRVLVIWPQMLCASLINIITGDFFF